MPSFSTTTILVAILFGVSASAQSHTPSVRDGLRATAQTQSKQVAVSPEVDIRIAHPEYNAIGRVDALLPEGISHATGVLISECLVLTNRHVIGEAGKDVTFRVGYTGDPSKPFAYIIKGTVVGTGGQGLQEYEHGEDWAIIKLNQSIGKKRADGGVGSIPAVFADEAKVKSCPAPEIAGFPGDRTEEIMTHHQNCPFEGAAGGTFGFVCPVKHGESGSPVMCRFPDGSFKIISIVRTSETEGRTTGAVDFSYDREVIKKIAIKYRDTCP